MTNKRRGFSKPVTGTAFKIYMIMLSKGSPMGVREIQHAVGLKSASTVKYHLDRLRASGLVRQLPDGKYEAVKPDNPLFAGYVFVFNTPVPRLVPVAIGYAVFIATYALLANVTDPVLIIASLGFALYTVFEAWRLRKLLKYLSGE